MDNMDFDFEMKDEGEGGFVGVCSETGLVTFDVSRTSPTPQWPNQKFENHCVFCLQPQELGTLQGISKENPRLSEDFRTVIHFLTGTNPNVTCDGTWKDGDEDEEDGRTSIRWISNLSPVMCPSCHGILAELYRLHRELLRIQWKIQKQTEEARKEIVTNVLGSSLPSSSGMPAEEAQLVGRLHTKILAEASRNKEVKFPSRLPPDFVPAAPPHPQPTNSPETKPQRQMFKCEVPFTRCDKRLESRGSPSTSDSSFRGRPSTRSRTTRSQSTLPTATEGRVDPTAMNEGDGFIGPDLEEPDLDFVDNEMEEDYVPSPLESESASSDSSPSSPEPTSPPPNPNRKRKRREQRARISSPAKITTREKSNRCRKRPPLVLPLVVNGDVTSQHCDLCGELCPSAEIRHHLEAQHHVKEFIAKCPNPACPYIFSCRGKLEKHLLQGGGWASNTCRKKGKLPPAPARRRCAVCSFKAKTVSEFRRHLKEKHEDEATPDEKNLFCPIEHCDKKYALKQSVEEHLFAHDPEDSHRSGSRRKMANGILLKISQKCDLCGEEQRDTEIVEHLEQVHHVKDFITKCINPDCSKVYSCRGKMERHAFTCRAPTSRQRGPTTIKCDTCELDIKRFNFLRHLQEHELKLKDKSLSCPIPGCTDQYSLRQSVDLHLVTHKPSNKSKQECSLCRQLIELADVSEHLKDVHNVDKPIQCKRCPFLFHDWEALLDHMYLHRNRHCQGGGGGFSCDLCDDNGTSGIRFGWYELLRQHFFNVHQIGKQFICEECDKDFFSLRALAAHKKNKHSIKPDDQRVKKSTKKCFKCEQCPDISFSNKQVLLNHNMKFHGAPPLPCKFCEETFTAVHELQKHQRIHLGLQRSYKCDVENCGKVCESLGHLKDHQRGAHSDHPGANLLMCETCGKEYVTEQSLRHHVDTVHLGKEKPRRVCELCGESFVSWETLRRHNLIHTGERPHICALCGQAFRTRGVLATHMKGHEEKGDSFKPNGPMKNVRKRVERK